MAETLTAPEKATERELARRQRIKVTQAGGCPYCIHRLTNWGGCSIDRRTFPMCLKAGTPSFEPDNKRLKG